MGSPCQIRLKASSLPHAQALCAPLIQEAARFEAKYSRYLPSSLVSQINQSAGATHRLDAEAAAIIDYAAQLFVQSDGLFDITSGLLRKAWDFPVRSCPMLKRFKRYCPALAGSAWNGKTPFCVCRPPCK